VAALFLPSNSILLNWIVSLRQVLGLFILCGMSGLGLELVFEGVDINFFDLNAKSLG
jgi:hypothetical protein